MLYLVHFGAAPRIKINDASFRYSLDKYRMSALQQKLSCDAVDKHAELAGITNVDTARFYVS